MAEAHPHPTPTPTPAPTRPKYTIKPRPDGFTAEAHGAYDSLVGELLPGDSGFLTLDAAGTPTGAATLLPPAGQTPVIRVTAQSPSPTGDVLTTTTGAALHAAMNASPDPRPTPPPPPPPEGDTLSSKSKVTSHGRS